IPRTHRAIAVERREAERGGDRKAGPGLPGGDDAVVGRVGRSELRGRIELRVGLTRAGARRRVLQQAPPLVPVAALPRPDGVLRVVLAREDDVRALADLVAPHQGVFGVLVVAAAGLADLRGS